MGVVDVDGHLVGQVVQAPVLPQVLSQNGLHRGGHQQILLARFRAAHLNYQSVMAVPNKMYISGYDSKAVNPLVLWSAKSSRLAAESM